MPSKITDSNFETQIPEAKDLIHDYQWPIRK